MSGIPEDSSNNRYGRRTSGSGKRINRGGRTGSGQVNGNHRSGRRGVVNFVDPDGTAYAEEAADGEYIQWDAKSGYIEESVNFVYEREGMEAGYAGSGHGRNSAGTDDRRRQAEVRYAERYAETGYAAEDVGSGYEESYVGADYEGNSTLDGYAGEYVSADYEKNRGRTAYDGNYADAGYENGGVGSRYDPNYAAADYEGNNVGGGYVKGSAGEYVPADYEGNGAESGYAGEYAGADYEGNGAESGYAGEYAGADYEGNGAESGYAGEYADVGYEGNSTGIYYDQNYAGVDYQNNGAGNRYGGNYDTVNYEADNVESGYVENGAGGYIGTDYEGDGTDIEEAENFAGEAYAEDMPGGYEENYIDGDEPEYAPEAEYIEDYAGEEYGKYHRKEAKIRRREYEKKKRTRWTAAAVLCVGILLGAKIYIDSLAYKICRVEAGVMPKPSDFMKNSDENAVFAEDSQPFDIAEPGEYTVKVKSGLFTHKCKLIIQDTIPPKGQAVRKQVDLGAACEPEEFVTNIVDATEVEVSYVGEPNFSQVGSQQVRIALTDKGENQTILETEMFVAAVMGNVTVEAGAGCPGLDRFVIGTGEASFVTEISGWDYRKVADHEVVLRVDGKEYTSILHVVDTVPPEVEVRDVEGYALQPRKAEDFIASVKDVTEVKAAFGEEPDLSQIGTQEVTLVFTDEGDNEVVKTARLTLREDKEAPVIHGAKDISIYVGESVSYRKNVTVTDNCPEGVTLSVDNQGVNLNEAGVYPVTYRAEDLAGNTSTVTINLTVRKNEYDVNEVNAMADAVLAQIIKPEMSQLEKAEAIYKYVSKNITYISTSAKGNWIRAAWEGLSDKKGDCYVFACTAKVLLTRANITNMDIAKVTPTSEHYWSLVDVGDGWYHYDTTPRKDHTTFFMWTDKDLMAYSDSHNDSHKYDHSLYPEVN